MSNHLILSVPISMCLEVLHHDHSNKGATFTWIGHRHIYQTHVPSNHQSRTVIFLSRIGISCDTSSGKIGMSNRQDNPSFRPIPGLLVFNQYWTVIFLTIKGWYWTHIVPSFT